MKKGDRQPARMRPIKEADVGKAPEESSPPPTEQGGDSGHQVVDVVRHSAIQGEVRAPNLSQVIALEQLAIQHYVALRVGLEGTYAAGLQILFGAIAIWVGTLAYLFFPNIPVAGRTLAHWVVEPTAMVAILFSIVFVLLPHEKESITHASLRNSTATLPSTPAGQQSTLATLQHVIAEASAILDRRQDGLRATLTVAAGWAAFSSIAVWLLLRLEPAWLDALESLRQQI